MHPPFRIPVWKTAPFIRVLFPFTVGIILQWYVQFHIYFILVAIGCFSISFFFFYYLPLTLRYKLFRLQGILLNLIIATVALFVTRQQDIRHKKTWFGHQYKLGSALVVKLNEPLLEKINSFKADAIVEAVINGEKSTATTGKLLLYFQKNDTSRLLRYGNKLIITARLQRLANSGNPGAFNYKRYAAFQQLFYNVYLKSADFKVLSGKEINPFYRFIFSAQQYIVSTIKKFLPQDKNIVGIAEALLIGYKEDLDKDLVQAYSNTGVVHIIAISGLHLGLIYFMLLWIFTRLPLIKKSKFARVTLILSCLWLFSILTGASASVLRSAVMFTCIVIGNNFFKQASIYNSLAASAFVLLCYNPYFLWDVGFQLSYLAVFGIVWLQQPIYRQLYIKDKWGDKLWSMVSVTIAAQVITFPICIYYFHQFPNMFLITNLLVVPLSTIILFAEIFLIAISWWPGAAFYAGRLIYWLIWLMNYIITICNNFYFSLIDKIYATAFSTWLLYAFVLATCYWLLYKNKIIFRLGLVSLLAFTMLHAFAKFRLQQQQKIIIYNVSKHRAIDFVHKNKYHFIGDSILQVDGVLQNFHLKPARVALQLEASGAFNNLEHHNKLWHYAGKICLFMDSSIVLAPLKQKIRVDILLISKNPNLHIADITTAVTPAIVVLDASNSLWKIENWKKECEQLLLRCHSIPEKGAFILDVE
ncbi:MAG: ComEC/Rec2 family competence protein [Ferruginibacter sp.]